MAELAGARDGQRDAYGFELPLLLFAGFRALIDQLHAELVRQGHPDMRPAHGFAMQAIGRTGVTASELGRRLGVSKQAAGKTVDRLVGLGYVERVDDAADARRKLVRLTPLGVDALRRSAAIFEDLRARWADTLGVQRLRDLEDALRTAVPADHFRLDVAGWFGT
ncbi:MarR family winged helix-turn-helix transcriptional regulator [Goodfellowiella coeruleoviolacea]|uniref:DNA-binding transcriptional regulator, MarR family n=1 Tax=Goodfellowiella coeruleoviolacea TaxID=334858 RepID=A0AAE3GE25_9PSEU|nr:MarR family winged helix-turn-helix transcriptional regulator [Goodfellowiella coeruleoviolacea]MCP2165597.1 DNA-binding transcriptional regulator, MarR family [Goodfellowiella coeruleoviolacea]